MRPAWCAEQVTVHARGQNPYPTVEWREAAPWVDHHSLSPEKAPRTNHSLKRGGKTLTLHRRELLQQTNLSGGGLDLFAQKKVVLRTRKRPTREWDYPDD